MTKDEVEFLVQFVPARKVEEVVPGLPRNTYVSGSYEGDVQIAKRVEEICDKYNVDIDSLDDEEDFENV